MLGRRRAGATSCYVRLDDATLSEAAERAAAGVRGVPKIHTILIVLRTNYSQPFDYGLFPAANRLRSRSGQRRRETTRSGSAKGEEGINSHTAGTLMERANHAGPVEKAAVRLSGQGLRKDCGSVFASASTRLYQLGQGRRQR